MCCFLVFYEYSIVSCHNLILGKTKFINHLKLKWSQQQRGMQASVNLSVQQTLHTTFLLRHFDTVDKLKIVANCATRLVGSYNVLSLTHKYAKKKHTHFGTHGHTPAICVQSFLTSAERIWTGRLCISWSDAAWCRIFTLYKQTDQHV